MICAIQSLNLQIRKIETNEDIEPVIKEAFAVDGPSLIEVNASLEYLAAYINMSTIRAAVKK